MAIAVVARDAALRHKVGGTVHISGRQVATGAKDCVGLGQTRRAAAADDGRVVGAGDGYRNGLSRAVGGGHRDAVGNDLPACQRVQCRVGSISPGARRVN